jgi:RNA polymerase sigma factor (sigma-70 family)
MAEHASEHEIPSPLDPKIFTSTLWTTVIQVAQTGPPEKAEEALNQLCRTYWHPLKGYFERSLRHAHEAEDLTAIFFETMLQREFLSEVRKDKGKFRSWLLKAAQRVLLDYIDKRDAKKRGGGQSPLSLDAEHEDGTPLFDPADQQDAAKIFEREYVMATIERVFQKMEREFVAARKEDEFPISLTEAFALFLPCVLKTNEEGYDEIGRRLGKSEGAIKQILRRLRLDFERLFRAEVAETLSSPDEFDEEVRYLLRVLEA